MADNDTVVEAPARYFLNTEDKLYLERAFTYHSPQGDQPARYTLLRGQAQELARTILEFTPPSRERSLALTNLEQAVMWANAGIARNE